MNDAIMRNALKMVKSFIGEDQIKSMVADIIHKAIDYKNNIELDTLNDEADAALMLYEIGGVMHSAIVILDPENRIIRFENVQTQEQLIEKIIEKY